MVDNTLRLFSLAVLYFKLIFGVTTTHLFIISIFTDACASVTMETTTDDHLNSRCSVCASLLPPPGFCSPTALRQASNRGCTICTLLYTALSEKHNLNDPKVERVDSIGGYGFFNLVAGTAKPGFGMGSLWDHISVTLALDGEGYCPSSLAWLPVQKKSPLSRTKERDIQVIRDRIENCRTNHPNCPGFHPSHIKNLPTRVIDVGLDGKRPFLYHSYKGERARYLALSHRWGDPKTQYKKLLTLTGNASSHCKGIPLDEFPRTFREAIEVTRGLGIQYLWIDSICIIQDDEKDWEAEAGRMCDVYSNAFATIFADRARHSDDGLFQNRKDRETPRSVRVIEYKDNDSEPAARVLLQTQINTNIANFATEVRELFCQADQSASQLTGRGWILQEECLSQRRIHFTETELKWKCPTEANCECGLRTLVDLYDPVDNFSNLVDPEKAKKQPWKTPESIWQAIVVDYTSRSLTYETDRIVALAGIAAKVREERQDYLGGLWRKQLNTTIFWKAASRCHRTIEYVAPSWSWASVVGKIRFIPRSKEERFIWDVIETECRQNGDFGRISSAHLKVRSKIVHVQVEERPLDMRKELAQSRWDSGDAEVRPMCDGVKYLTVMPVQRSPECAPPLPTMLGLDVQSDWDILTSGVQSDLRLLCISLTNAFWKFKSVEIAKCLLLRRSPKESSSWERICYVCLKGGWESWKPFAFEEEIIIL
ncbi:HET-domain-containing protein [Annulohypoxylon truncatum]|uniref:HET-domain-containing protein n=1 Tax=Annulohypoxylon truncatum TaxID=327061 RepID=UPI00200825A3|nr:HET-domain-containing protein [Annulohypoxylon truncatum]KAI1205046.1 HET-domain-containing protein [Annulohypoxylon truncatum]